MSEENVPQWKRELIDRRRASGRAASVGPLHFTCPGVVSALRQPDLSPGMRLPTQVSDIQQFILSQIEVDKKSKMGEEKTKKASAAGDGRREEGTGDEGNLSDSSEEFKYGPGIVSKLKSKYLSLTLRETNVKVRPALSNLRRATSLENILDEAEKSEEAKQPKFIKHVNFSNGTNIQSRRGITRNKENMKRARSVEAIMRYNQVSEFPINDAKSAASPVYDSDKSRNRVSLEEKELPPPDLVKQTLRLFEPEGAKPPPAPLFKCSSTPKNTTISAKPAIYPKPATHQPKVLLSSVNGFAPNEENKGKSRGGPGSPDSPRIVAKDVIKIPAKVEIIENVESAKSKSQDKSVIQSKDLHIKKDVVDACNTKEKFSLRKDRSPSEVPTNEGKRTTVSVGGDLLPSPRPRLLPKAAERRQVDSPISTPIIPPVEILRPVSPIVNRASPEILHSPSSPMKQVGVIRPIITQKFSPQPPTTKPSQVHNDRELEKNLKNKVKSIEQPVTKVIVSLKKSPEECTVTPKLTEDKQATGCTWGPKPHSMVFNFSNRKEVPDYIENDGLILTSKKDRLQVGDSGVVLLPGCTADSTSDFEVEDSTGPPSPCHLVIVGGNVLINGKSSLQKSPKATKLRIKFNDEATTFEYPSESSMLEDSSGDSRNSGPHNLPLRSGNLSSYTPSQLAQSTEFQLGITRTVVPPPSATKPAELSDEEDYLRPAEDPVAWSATTASDLLF